MIRDALKAFANQYLLTPFSDVCNATERAEKSRRKDSGNGVSQKNRDAGGISTRTPSYMTKGVIPSGTAPGKGKIHQLLCHIKMCLCVAH